ncbi:hypothetical protein ATOP_07150 [Granulimonas faecalis]|uniref:NusG-like N-terminal domain-containing protein n=1 Tax=Granulimonas faecalis TaxID=2894155 RepID=A0AAV5B2P2_9ACTN|nr:antiterminator LoaP [Granulimonas faecalis]GJM55060.1 hypothetical protein ATOP_07150 [Granulimonas faecalis]
MPRDHTRTYVLQTMAGRERKLKEAVERGVSGVGECYICEREVAEKRDGRWVRAVKRLLPGYVFVRTDDPDTLAAGLRGLPGFSRLLGVSGERFLPLTPGEEAWLGALANPDTHVVELSQGVIEGDRVRVSAGPLKGLESAIRKVDRHKRTAWIEVSLMGRTKLVKVGMEIVRKQG